MRLLLRIVTVDVTAYIDGVHGDLNQTFAVGEIDQRSRDLMETTRRALLPACASALKTSSVTWASARA